MESGNYIFNRLPIEIVAKILSYLPATFRKEARLVCSRLYETSKDITLLKHQKFVFDNLIYNNNVNLMFEPLKNGNFCYYNLEFFETSLDEEFEAFLDACGAQIFSLVFCCCSLSSKTVEKIMTSCINLKELRFIASDYYSDSNLDIPTFNQVQIIRNTLEILEVSLCDWMSDSLLTVLVSVYPNLKQIVLEEVNLAYNRRTFDQYYKNVNTYQSSDIIFTFNHFHQTIIQKCNKIKKLNLASSTDSFSDDDMIKLASTTNLRLDEINLSGHYNISSKGLKEFLIKQRSITSLAVSNCTNFDFECVQFLLQENSNIESLNISLTVDMPKVKLLESLAKSSLKSFQGEFYGDVVDLEGTVNPLLKNNNLQCLNITFHSIGDALLLPILKMCDNLTELDLSNSYIEEGNPISSYIFENLVNLQTVILYFCRNWVNDATFENSTGRLRNLQHLVLQGCSDLTEEAIKKFSYPKLKVLDLNGCSKVKECGIAHLSETSPLLECLSINEINISNDVLLNVCQKLNFLRKLHIDRTPALKVDYSTAQDLVRCCPSLRIIAAERFKAYVYNFNEKRLSEKNSQAIS